MGVRPGLAHPLGSEADAARQRARPEGPLGSPRMFRDEAKIYVKAGDGGDGSKSFRREIYVPKGGPDGGDGGQGGSVILLADASETTLLSLVRSPHLRAKSGDRGHSTNSTGKSGEDLVVRVPVGTIVRVEDTGEILADLAAPGDQSVVARGGKGGRGNSRFKSSTNQTPTKAEPGRPGQIRTLRLELKLIADVGLIGLPNAGKSTLISRISAATPKIADYPFTTLEPHPGIVDLSGFRRFVMMDIPGLIAGAHLGAGLGDKFLRHVERTRVLVHLVDLAPTIGEPEEHYRTILEELRSCGRGLLEKPRLLVFSQADKVADPNAKAAELAARLGVTGYAISAQSGLNLGRLLEDCWKRLEEVPREGAVDNL